MTPVSHPTVSHPTLSHPPVSHPTVSHPTVSRRRLLLGASAITGAGAMSALTGTSALASPTAAAVDPSTRKPILVGSNPAVQLFDGGGASTGYVSVWRVDWSIRGSGRAIVLWRPSGVLAIGADRRLTLWLATYFVQNFPELEGLPFPTPRYLPHRVHAEGGLDDGLRARGGPVEVAIRDVLDVRAFATDEFTLGTVEHSLSLVLGPCGSGRIQVDGRRVPGTIQREGTSERPSSSAFVTEAEVWRR